MTDRYSTITREVPVDRPRNTAYPDATTATGDLNSQHRVSLHPAGFRVRERGALSGTVVHAYRCPVHGLVDVRVPRGEVPDEVPCPAEVVPDVIEWSGGHRESMAAAGAVGRRLSPNEAYERYGRACGHRATWAGSQAGQGWAAGECRS